MKIESWLKTAVRQLQQAGCSSARLDAELLLSTALQKPREFLLAHPETEIAILLLKELTRLLERRVGREPLAYIVGHKEFYGREFVLTSDVLVPRPETETMIDLLKHIVKYETENKQNKLRIADIGSGSGCLAISAKLELLDVTVTGSDTSQKALEVARTNAKNLQAEVEFLHGSLLEPYPLFHLPPSIILANLPYVPTDYPLNEEAQGEPKEALGGGADGLDLYRQFFHQAGQLSPKATLIFTEALDFQQVPLAAIAKENGYKLKTIEGLIQVFS